LGHLLPSRRPRPIVPIRKYSAIQDGQAMLLQSLTVSAVPAEHSAATHPPQRSAGTQGAAAFAVAGPAVFSLASALCPPLRGVLVHGRNEGMPGGLHDIGG